MSAQENKALVERFVEEFWNEGNTSAADELMPNPIGTSPAMAIDAGSRDPSEQRSGACSPAKTPRT